MKRGSLPTVPSRPHPAFADYDILYVGIAASGPKSKSTLKSRVVGNHIRGNIGASTFRLTLASLLAEPLELVPWKATTRVLLTKEANSRLSLSEWQQTNLMMTWHVVPSPRELEKQVIDELKPPLNLADNTADDFLRDASGRSFRGGSRFRATTPGWVLRGELGRHVRNLLAKIRWRDHLGVWSKAKNQSLELRPGSNP